MTAGYSRQLHLALSANDQAIKRGSAPAMPVRLAATIRVGFLLLHVGGVWTGGTSSKVILRRIVIVLEDMDRTLLQLREIAMTSHRICFFSQLHMLG